MPAEGDEMQASETTDANGVARIVSSAAGDVLTRLRAAAPRVHCITNTVAQAYTANMLLAAGAIPSMTTSPEEIGGFVAGANALLVNLGTFDHGRRIAGDRANGAATDGGIPWVLDPVLIDRSPDRAAYARDLLTHKPAVVRLNRAEFGALGGGDDLAGFAGRHGVVVALSGQVDRIVGGGLSMSIANGDPLMARVTAMGCAASALTAACLCVETDPARAAATALLALGIAGEIAAETATGPGTFSVAIVDALYRLDGDDLCQRARVS
jgi:hydroxyethylthiazole kinase